MAVSEFRAKRDVSSYLYDPKVRGLVFQGVMLATLIFFVWWITGNTIENLRRSNIASG